MSLMPQQVVPVLRVQSVYQAGPERSMLSEIVAPFDVIGAVQSLCNALHQPFEDPGAGQSDCLSSPFIPFEG